MGPVTPAVNRTPPAYVQIADRIRNQITAGDLAEGDPLPSLADIVNDWGVSKETASRAIRRLRMQGFVADRRGQQPAVGVPQTVPAPAVVADAWGIEEGAAVRMQVDRDLITFSRE